MRKTFAMFCVVAGVLLTGGLTLSAQEVIHALTGTVRSIDAASHSITVLQDNGNTTVFHERANTKASVSFDKRVAAEAMAADQFKQEGQYVIVFYYGEDENRTAVALKPMGKGPFTAASGTLKSMNKHEVTLQDEKGAVQTFRIDENTVGEGMFGVVEGSKLSPDKGTHVRVVASTAGGTPTALFVRAL